MRMTERGFAGKGEELDALKTQMFSSMRGKPPEEFHKIADKKFVKIKLKSYCEAHRDSI